MSGAGPWDPGLQHERTTMAWFRSVMAFFVVGALAARQSSRGAAVLLLGVLFVAAVMVMAVDRRHRARARWLAEGRHVTALVEAATTTAVVVLLATWSLVVVVSR